MQLFNRFQRYSLSLKTKLVDLLVGFPSHNLTSEETIKQLVKFERFSIFFRASRFGFNQNVSNRSTKIDYFGLIMRAIGQINFIRLVCLVFVDDQDYQLYLGDIAFKTKHRVLINILFAICFLIGVVANEWLVSFDKSGKYNGLAVYSSIINNGFDPVHLQMTAKQAIKFHRTIHLLITQLNRNFIFACLFLATCYYFMLLSNPNFYQIKELIFYGLAWSLVSIIPTITMTGQNMSTLLYLILMQAYHFFRLRSIVELTDSACKLKCTDKLISNLTELTFQCLNQSEKCAKSSCTIVLYAFTAVTLIGDLLTFYGLIIQFHSPLFADLSGSVGCLAFIVIGLLSLIAREFKINTERLNYHLYTICRYNVFNVYNQLKIFELMSRLNGPYNGIQLGQITTIGKDFFITPTFIFICFEFCIFYDIYDNLVSYFCIVYSGNWFIFNVVYLQL